MIEDAWLVGCINRGDNEALFTYPKSLSDAFFDPYSLSETLQNER